MNQGINAPMGLGDAEREGSSDSPISPRARPSTRISIYKWFLSGLATLTLISVAGVAQAQSTTTTGRSEAARFEQYGPYELPIPEVANVKVLFKTDLGVVVQEFQSYSNSDPLLLAYMASSSDVVAERIRTVVEDTGWGHVVPYLYAATYHFFGRIYYGISSGPVLADGTPLLPKRTLTAGQITIRVVSNSDTWQTYVGQLGHSSAAAYWDPLRSEVGIYVDEAMFRGAASQAKWTGRTKTHNVGILEDYITRLVIRDIGHELFHAIQQRTPSRDYELPLLSEGSALFAQHNVFQREETVGLLEAQTQAANHYAIDRQAADKCIGGAFAGAWAGDYFTVGKLHRVHEYVRYRPEFSLTELLSLGPETFYSAQTSELSNRYAIAFSTYWFLKQASRETLFAWNRVSSDLLKTGQLGQVEADALEVDLQYRAWIERLANQWWSHSDAQNLYVQARLKHTYCLNALQFYPAWLKAVVSAAYLPGNPTSPLYLGDIYWRIQHFYDAFEYYTVANNVAQPELYGEYTSRLKSRLADAAQQLGNIQVAMDLYKEVTELPLEHPSVFLVFTRSRLKYEYYRLTEHDGSWLTEQSRLRLSDYVQALQSPENSDIQSQLLDRQDWEGYMSALTEQYNVVLTHMLQDLGVTTDDTP